MNIMISAEKHMVGELLLQILMLISKSKGLCNYKHNFYHFDVWLKQDIIVVACSVFALLCMNIKHCNMVLLAAH